MPRRLFLDDDPARAAAFLAWYPDATWVQTVPECLGKLAERWAEVHLDHDLGGEHYVNSSRDDCGMEVVRWLTNERRPHLARVRFTVHSHNMVAAYEMVSRLRGAGLRATTRPFGLDLPEAPPSWLHYWRIVRFGLMTKIRRVADRVARARLPSPPAHRQPAEPPEASDPTA